MDTQHQLKTTDQILDIRQQLKTMDMKARLSALWIVILLNILFRDIHDLLRPGLLEEMMTGVIDGAQVKDETLLVAGVALSIFIAMVALSRILPYRFNRPANIIVASIMILTLLVNGPQDLDDTWYFVVELVVLVFVIWSAWTWSNSNKVLRLNVTD